MFKYEFMQNAFIAGIIIAILCPIIGSFLVYKRFSMMGDTLSHSAFGGVATAIFLGYEPGLFSLFYTVLNALLIEVLRRKFKSYEEIILNVFLTFNVGLAIVLASSKKIKTSINQFLFGSILTVTKKDLIIIGLVALICIAFILINYSKMIYLSFDEEGGKIHGLDTKSLNYIFSIMTGATIGVSIRVTGLLVISSVLIMPVATALNFKKGFNKTMFISILTGLATIILGLVLSYYIDSAPGGTIALISVASLLISLGINYKKL